jgi:hypothetical protein
MYGDPIKFDHPESVEFDEHRWYVRITIKDNAGTEHVYFASADGWYTDSNNIWFGTKAEYEEAAP